MQWFREVLPTGEVAEAVGARCGLWKLLQKLRYVLESRSPTPKRPLRTRAIAAFMAIATAWHFEGSPLYSAWWEPAAPKRDSAKAPASGQVDSIRFDDLLIEARDLLRSARSQATREPQSKLGALPRLREVRDAIGEENLKVERHFAEVDSLVASRSLSSEVQARNQTLARSYRTKYVRLRTELDAVLASSQRSSLSIEGVDRALGFLDENTPPSPHPRLDPKHLPFRSLRAERPIEPGTGFAVRSAAAPGGGGLGAGDEPTIDDLKETIEVQFTPEIRKLADDLGRSPIKIFNWVRNNIEFVPTWGSIQGAQLCLETRRGNAFDTASLLIALLRVSGIPARYQTGTIEVPKAEAMDWLGGFKDPAAAARFAASGGIPGAGTVEREGSVRAIRMEHVWVRAFVDYLPSRAAAACGEGDTWVPLDAGFKLHDVAGGKDLGVVMGFDDAAIRQHIQEAVGSAGIGGQGVVLDPGFVDALFEASGQNVSKSYPGLQDFSSLVAHRRIRQVNQPVLSISLPYSVLAPSGERAEIPSGLRHGVEVTVLDEAGARLLSYAVSLPEIGHQELSLAYLPATDDDLQVIFAARDAGPFDPSSAGSLTALLDRLPVQLIRVRPAIKLNGKEVSAGLATPMARPQQLSVRFTAPTISTPDTIVDLVAWGNCAMVLDPAGNASALFKSRAQLADLQGAGLSVQLSRINSLMGTAWFAFLDREAELYATALEVAFVRYPSLAFAFPDQSVTSVFGAPVKIQPGNYTLDAARQLQVIAAHGGDVERERAFSLVVGMKSSILEGVVPPALLGVNPRFGLSTGGALAAAAAQGVPIYGIDAANVDTILPRIDDRFPLDRIADAARSGRVVVVPETLPQVDGVALVAYMTLDPDTGDGAYLVGRAFGGEVDCNAHPDPDGCRGWLSFADGFERLAVGVALGAFVAALILSVGGLVAAVVGVGAGVVTIDLGALILIGLSLFSVIEADHAFQEFRQCQANNESNCAFKIVPVVVDMIIHQGLHSILLPH